MITNGRYEGTKLEVRCRTWGERMARTFQQAVFRQNEDRGPDSRLVNLSQISQISIIYDVLFSPANSSEPTLAATFGTSWQGSTCTVAAWSFNCPLVRKIGKTYRILSIFIDKFTSLISANIGKNYDYGIVIWHKSITVILTDVIAKYRYYGKIS